MKKLNIYSDGNLDSTFITINDILIENLSEILISITQKNVIIRISILDEGNIIILKSLSEILQYFCYEEIIDTKEFHSFEKLEVLSQKNDSLISVSLNDNVLSKLIKMYIHLKTNNQEVIGNEFTLTDDLELFVSFYEIIGFNNKTLIKSIFPNND